MMMFSKRSYVFLFIAFVALCLVNTVLADGRDFYKILGLAKRATDAEIKKSYRKLSMKYHPDKNAGSRDAEKMFQDVANAYEVLSDKEKRRMYDQGGEEALQRHQQQGGARGGHNPFDIFSQFFGGGGHGHGQDEVHRAPGLTIDIPVSLKDIYVGGSVDVLVKHQAICHHCRGTGAFSEDHVTKCSSCKGQGVVMVERQIGPGFIQRMQSPCTVCSGKGKVVSKPCPICAGKKTERASNAVDVVIEQGIADGSVIEFPSTWDEHPDKAAGSLIFRVRTVKHPIFERKGDDLHMELNITLKEALIGFEHKVEHLDGHNVLVKRTSITKPSSTIRIKNEGMPKHNSPSDRGALHVKINVIFPTDLTEEQKSGFNSIF